MNSMSKCTEKTHFFFLLAVYSLTQTAAIPIPVPTHILVTQTLPLSLSFAFLLPNSANNVSTCLTLIQLERMITYTIQEMMYVIMWYWSWCSLPHCLHHDFPFSSNVARYRKTTLHLSTWCLLYLLPHLDCSHTHAGAGAYAHTCDADTPASSSLLASLPPICILSSSPTQPTKYRPASHLFQQFYRWWLVSCLYSSIKDLSYNLFSSPFSVQLNEMKK